MTAEDHDPRLLGLCLSDLGERRLIDELLRPRYQSSTKSFGDDCVVLPPVEGTLVVTSDPCPTPVASILGFEDFYYWGWLLATINLSDLAAAGALPIGLLSDLQLPRDLPVSHFVRILDGLDDNCHAHGTRVLGGNLKETPQMSMAATALGRIAHGEPAGRHGASDGDALLLVGRSGYFWAGVLGIQNGLIADKNHPFADAVLRPLPQLAAGAMLQQAGILSNAMDNSDGLYSSLSTLVLEQGVGFDLDLDGIAVDGEVKAFADDLGIDPVRLLLGWGDWQLVATAPPSVESDVQRICEGVGVPLLRLGKVTAEPGVRARFRGQSGDLMRLDSQRFTKESWFTAGLETYIDMLSHGEVVV